MQLETKKIDFKKVKSFVILGFGKTAIATAKFLVKSCMDSKIKISELKTRENFNEDQILELEQDGIEFQFGEQTKDFIFEEDVFIVISPGIPPRSELIQEIFHSGLDYGTDLDIFSAFLSDEQDYVSITGTNGKTTTTSLLAHIFNSPALGNIGKPFLDFDEDNYPKFSCEISSFQAFYSNYFSQIKIPKVSVFLNFSSDHLDWHKDLNEYHASKAKLFCQSSKEDNYWVLNFDDPKVKNFGLKAEFNSDTKTKICYFSNQDISYALSESCPFVAYERDDRLYLARYLGNAAPADPEPDTIISVNENDDYFAEFPLAKIEDLNLVGKHNHANILAGALAALLMKFDLNYIMERVHEFKPVPHRLEFIREIGSNKIYNDSKATNPDSTLKAINSFDLSILILGGKEKNLDLSPFLDRVSKKAFAVIAIGELKNKIYEGLCERAFEKIRRADSLEEAVSLALFYADNNNYPIVLSPASSSFDMFKGFEDRGNQFKEIVLRY